VQAACIKKPRWKRTWYQRSKLQSDGPLSNVAFNFNVRRYNKEGTYVITYTVSDSAGMPNAVAATRTIVVTKDCKPPTFICLDQKSCSDPDKGNVCTADLLNSKSLVEEEAGA
jgi:hypothetical protein